TRYTRQQVGRDLVAEGQSAAAGFGLQVAHLLGLAERLEVVDEAPGEARAQVFSQRQGGGGRRAGGENRAPAVAGGIDRAEEPLLSVGVEGLHVVGDGELGIGARRGAQEMRASAAD